MAARRGTGGGLAGSGTHLILVQGVLVPNRGWLTHGNSIALWLTVMCVNGVILNIFETNLGLKQRVSPSPLLLLRNALRIVLLE